MARTSTDKVPATHALRPAVFAAGIAAVVALAVAAVVFTTASTSSDLVDEAMILQHAESTLGANDVAVKSLSQAVLLAEDFLLGVADSATVTVAVGEARQALSELGQAAAALDVAAARSEASPSVVAALENGSLVIELLDDGEVVAAGNLLTGDARDAFIVVRDTVDSQRDAAALVLQQTDDAVTRIAAIARFFVAFLIPLFAFFTYRFIARRQLRFAEVELDARLDAEQEIGRAKDEFVANISHELRTPLTSIFGFSELLIEQGIIDPESSLDVIRLIHTESAELSRMVEDLLASARADAGSMAFQLTEVDVANELQVVLDTLNRTGTNVQADCPTDPVWADQLRIRQILRNLISNAQRHGGPTIRVEGGAANGRLTIHVIDDGPGVPTDLVPRLFTRFIHVGRGPLIIGSVGLGLGVVKILAEGMNGEISYSRRGEWTIFSVAIPLAEVERHPEPVHADETPQASADLLYQGLG